MKLEGDGRAPFFRGLYLAIDFRSVHLGPTHRKYLSLMSIRDPALKKILVILGLLVLTLLYFHDVLTGKLLLA